jgi:IS4 transposase
MHRAGAFFVTDARSNVKAHRLYSAAVDPATGVVCDQTIVLDGHYARKEYPERLRRIRYNDAETGKALVFRTNHFEPPALTIAALYKDRWQVELFFNGTERTW